MTDENAGGPKGIKRRDFLLSASGLMGTAFTGIAWARPCPPPSLSVDGGTTAATTCTASSLPVITLTSAAASGTHAWTFGQVFRQGDVPSGSFITSDANSTQADVRNRWPDGSVRYAVLSGISSLTQNAAKPVALATSTSAPGGGNVAEPTTLDVAVTFSGDLSGTVTLQSCLGIDRSSWSKASAGRVRQILGPVMSEFHYYRPTSDQHVAVWFYVRRYSSGATEVETVIENGWMNVAGPGARNYGVTLSINGASRYSGSLTHFHHTRWSRVEWVGTDPQIKPRHDPAYLRSTRMVPNYGWTSPSSTALSGFASAINPAPFALGNWSADMPGTGDQGPIGLLPLWEALYCTSGDARVYAATISNNRGSGRWPIHYRDESTGRPARWQDWPNMELFSGWGPQAPPAASGGGPIWDIPHHPSNGYLAYLIEGRWPQLESLQFAAAFAILDTRPSDRALGAGGIVPCRYSPPITTRGAAWAWRTIGQAAAMSPTTLGAGAAPAADVSLQESFAASVGNTAAYHKAKFIDGTIEGGAHRNTIGFLGQYDGGDAGPAGQWWGRAWMVHFQSMALGHISNLGIENLAPANLVAVRNHSYQNVLYVLGDGTANDPWNFRHGAQYNRPYLKNSSVPWEPVFMTPTEAYAAFRSFHGLAVLSANTGDTLKAAASDADMVGDTTSSDAGAGYWSFALCALSLAVEHGVPGAAAKRARVTAAPNYNPGAHTANDDPRNCIVPA